MSELEFFDANVRVGTWTNPRPECPTDVQSLLRAMDSAGIARALVCHALAWQWDAAEGNKRLLEEIDGYDRLYPCLVALPPATGEVDPDALAEVCAERHGAVRAFPKDHQWRLTPWCAEDLFAALVSARVPLLVDLDQTNWDDIATTARDFPRLTLILLNTSYRLDRYLYPLWDRGYDIRVSIETYMPFGGLEDVCDRFGPERLVFGSGLPERDPAGPIALISYASVGDEAKRQIAGGNLASLLRLA